MRNMLLLDAGGECPAVVFTPNLGGVICPSSSNLNIEVSCGTNLSSVSYIKRILIILKRV